MRILITRRKLYKDDTGDWAWSYSYRINNGSEVVYGAGSLVFLRRRLKSKYRGAVLIESWD